MPAMCLPLYASSSTAASIKTKRPATKATTIFSTLPTFRRFTFTCKASNSSRCSPIPDYNLYDLLGIESSSNQSQIKSAYRALQKHCHPDIAGPAGHDMAIILNQAYSVLSDPSSRFAYDKVTHASFHFSLGRMLALYIRQMRSFYCAFTGAFQDG